MPSVALLVAFCCLFGGLLLWAQPILRPHRYPPGPKPSFILGNARELAVQRPWRYFASLKEKFGDVLFFSALGRPIVVLNSYKAIQDLIIRQSCFADRPRLVLGGEMVGWDNTVILMSTGPKWALHRKMFHQFLNKKAIPNFASYLETNIRKFAAEVADQPAAFFPDMQLVVARMIVGVTYGCEIESASDEFLVVADKITQQLSQTLEPGRFLVDLFPILKHVPKWLPCTGWKRLANIWRSDVAAWIEMPFKRSTMGGSKGALKASFVSHIVEQTGDAQLAKWVAGVMYGAALDTTLTSVNTFVRAMIEHPEILQKIQEELDRVVGVDRMPSLSDKAELPYLENVLKEVYRWHLHTPMALPYRSSQEYEYNGMYIPKNSTVLANAWAISRDETIYPSPEEFNPDRYLDRDVLDPRNFVFGFGRRICPGQHWAEAVVWLLIATVAHTMNIAKAVDGNGNQIEPDYQFNVGVLDMPKPFKCDFQPRSAASLDLLGASIDAA